MVRLAQRTKQAPQELQTERRQPVLLGSILDEPVKGGFDEAFKFKPLPEPIKIVPSEFLEAWQRVWAPTDSTISPPSSPRSERSTKPGAASESSVGAGEDAPDGGASELAPCMTIMRNIPNKYTRDTLLALLDRMGFKGAYALVYLPIDFFTKVAVGYAFVGFHSSEDATRFRSVFHGFDDWGFHRSSKVCEICWSEAEHSVEDHVQRYRNCPVMHVSVPDEYRPALFDAQGERQPFPPPTRAPRKPRGRGKEVRKWSNRA